MSYAIDLNNRQSARTLEQAIRQHAQVIVEPRAWNDHRHLVCRLEPTGSPLDLDIVPLITLAVLGQCEAGLDLMGGEATTYKSIDADELHGITGTYIDAVISLGEQRYMFSSDLLRMQSPKSSGEAPQVHLTRPAILQVAQRRRFRRIILSHSAQVELSWNRAGEPTMGGVAWLCNISGEGLACRTEERIAETMWIGEELDIEFTLAPGDSERFNLQGVLCSKTASGNLHKAILGIQFFIDENHPASAANVRVLRKRLMDRAAQLADMRKGVDY